MNSIFECPPFALFALQKRAAVLLLFGIVGVLVLGGCSGKYEIQAEQMTEAQAGEAKEEVARKEKPQALPREEKEAEPGTVEADWTGYFEGLNGTAVLYDASAREYQIFNSALAVTRRSPCSTFKIISSLIALENGILDPEDSVRPWSGEVFWNENWNRDIDFEEAFRTSCVWYFRELIDEIGQERMREGLDKLSYGNCDISDWEGRQNTNNNNRALTGFWLESSLAISPQEQVQVLERIFGTDSAYSKKTQDELRKVMLTEEDGSGIPVYGKTGMGKAQGVVVDAWFAGFAEIEGENVYFCVYLGRTDGENVSSTAAKEIAIRLINDYDSGLRNESERERREYGTVDSNI